MLCKLAWGNVRRARRDYLVYLITLGIGVMVFYAFNTISVQVDIAGIKTSGMRELKGSLMAGMTIFLAFVMGFLLVYANNFIMKRRKKEFGLYQVLGMSRWQVARVMALETVIVSVAALAAGLAAGIALSQLMVFSTAALFKTQVSNFHFFLSGAAFLITVGCLVAIFLVTLVFNLRVVAKAKIIDLMSAGRRGEVVRVRNPWISAAVFVVGAVLTGVAYARLLHDGLPVMMDDPNEMNRFYLTTGLVIVGTILLFFGLSGFLLKVLSRARNIYWRGLAPFTLRQLSSRVNTVSFSLAVVAMVLFLAITSVTSGTSLLAAMNSSLENGTPADYTAGVAYFDEQRSNAQGTGADGNAADGISPTYGVTTQPLDLMAESARRTVSTQDGGTKPMTADDGRAYNLADIAGDHVQVNLYSSYPASQTGTPKPVLSGATLFKMAGASLPTGADDMGLDFMKESDYNRYLAFRGAKQVDLGESGYLITSDAGTSMTNVYDKVLAGGTELKLGGRTLKPVASSVDAKLSAIFNTPTGGSNPGTIVVPDEVVDELNLTLEMSSLLINYKDGISTEQGDAYVTRAGQDGSYDNVNIVQDGHEVGVWGYMSSTRTKVYESANSLSAMVSYLAIYIGMVLVVACAAILTIQQLSGVSDAGPSCRMLSEIGASTRQVNHSFLVQQAVLFAFPLAVGIAHSAVALHVVIGVVELFGHVEISGMVGLACAIFAVCYGGYFLITYHMSRKIIRDAIAARA